MSEHNDNPLIFSVGGFVRNFLITILVLFSFFNVALQAAKITNYPRPLIQEDLWQWYKKESGVWLGKYFGIYDLTKVGQKIYFGIGSDRPAAKDGAMLAEIDVQSQKLVNKSYLDEQGFVEIMAVGQKLLFPGADPALPRFGWSSGNWYRVDLTTETQEVELKRNLPFVVHGWGMWYDAKKGIMYHSASEVTCDHLTRWHDCYKVEGADGHGVVFSSPDFGDNWTKLAAKQEGMGTYRTYDIEGTSNDLILATWADYDETTFSTTCGQTYSLNDGKTWTRVSGVKTTCLERLTAYKQFNKSEEKVLTFDDRHEKLVIFSDYTKEVEYLELPAAPSAISHKHLLDIGGERVLFASEKGIYLLTSLRTWKLIAGTESFGNIRSLYMDKQTNLLYFATPTQIYEFPLSP